MTTKLRKITEYYQIKLAGKERGTKENEKKRIYHFPYHTGKYTLKLFEFSYNVHIFQNVF